MGWYQHTINAHIMGSRSAHNSDDDVIDLGLWNEIYIQIKRFETDPRYARLGLVIEIEEYE